LGEFARLTVLAGLLRRLTAVGELLRLGRLELDELRDGLAAREAAAGLERAPLLRLCWGFDALGAFAAVCLLFWAPADLPPPPRAFLAKVGSGRIARPKTAITKATAMFLLYVKANIAILLSKTALVLYP
jgi:hypothetical protein